MLTTLETSKPLRRGEACICCRQQKTKCDGSKPSCTQCLNMQRECGYSAHLSRLQKLERKIKSLEDRIQTASSFSASTGNNALSSRGLGPNPPIIDHGRRDAITSSSSTNYSFPQSLNRDVDKIPGNLSLNRGLDVPVELRQQMLQIFIDYRSDFLVDIYLPRLQASMHLPPSHPNSLHPALTNAIFLAATLYCGPELQSSVSIFLQRTREGLRSSLAFADRLDDFFWASIILSWYYMRSGRMLEAYDTAETVSRLAVGCDMHIISDPVEYSKTRHGLLNAPRDKFHVGERVNMWWSIYLLDRHISFAMSLPGSLPLSTSAFQWTTVFPRSFEEIDRHGLETWPSGSYKELFEPGHQSVIATNDTLLALRAKSTVLLACSFWRPHLTQVLHPDGFFPVHARVTAALNLFHATLPSTTDPRGTSNSGYLPVVNPTIVHVHCCIYAACIYLHNFNASRDPVEHRRCLGFAHAMASLLRKATNSKFMCVYVCLVPCWYHAAKILVREIHKRDHPGTSDEFRHLKAVQADLSALVEGMSKLTWFYPKLGSCLQRFEALVSSNQPYPPLKVEDEEESPFFNPPYLRLPKA